jgi:serine/threonine protein kinase/outer membrane protein assembly factor BamB
MGSQVEIGGEIAGYRVESILGRGGMGVVYLAEHLRLKRKVALKVLAPELSADERFRERFVRESELAASLDHPNVVTVHDAGEQDGLLYIAMRFVEGTDLKTVIERDGPMALDRAASIVAQVASALDAAHAKGLIHRDVKPANVLIRRDPDGSEHAYLTDFGLTKRPDETTGLTKTGQFMGSVDYAAPEQFEGKPLDARTDVYSLACVAYECLTGKVPYPLDQEAAVMYAHLQAPPPRVSATRDGIPGPVDDVVARGMAKRPEDRYRSAGALASALRRTLAPERPGERIDAPAGRPRWLLPAGATVIVAMVAVVAFLLLRHEPGSGPAGPGPSATLPATGLILRIDPSTGSKPSSIHPALRPRSMAVGGGFVWIGANVAVEKVRSADGAVVADVRGAAGTCNYGTACQITSIAIVDGHVWVAAPTTTTTGGGQIAEIDASTNRIVHHVDVPSATALLYFDGSLWVTNPAQGELTRIDPTTRKVLATLAAESSSRPSTMAGGEGAVWVVDGTGGIVSRIDATANRVTVRIPTEDASGVAVGEGGVWITSTKKGTVTEYDLQGSRVIRSVQVARSADSIVVANGSVWVASFTDGRVIQLDPASGKILRVIDARPAPYALVEGEGSIWVMEAPGFVAG